MEEAVTERAGASSWQHRPYRYSNNDIGDGVGGSRSGGGGGGGGGGGVLGIGGDTTCKKS